MVTLYSTDCPRCKVLKKKLESKGIEYQEVNDIEVMKEKGFLTVPVLVVGEDSLDFTAANAWINNN